ncbi:MAG: hypothetical protein HGB34_04350 [Candidatus Moranbacteria bacterium]|nr:hypothetical protein [Candidatus Moranbacteria bacterium]
MALYHRSPSIKINSLSGLGLRKADLIIPKVILDRLPKRKDGCKRPKLVVHNFLNDDITFGDRVIVTTEKKKGISAIRASYQRHDPFLPNNGRSKRVPTFSGWQQFGAVRGNVCMGTISKIEILPRPAKMKTSEPTEIRFHLTDVRIVQLHTTRTYLLLGSLVTEIEVLSFESEIIETHRKTFNTDRIPLGIRRRIPKPLGKEARLLQPLLRKAYDALPLPDSHLARLLTEFT